MNALTGWFTALSRREQILIAILGVLVALTLTFYGIYRPLYTAATAAKTRHYEVTMQAGRIKAKLNSLNDPAAQTRPVIAAALHLFIASEAAERGFTLERNQANGDDRTQITIASARAPAFLSWIADLETRGILVEDLVTRRMDNGTITVSAILMKTGA